MVRRLKTEKAKKLKRQNIIQEIIHGPPFIRGFIWGAIIAIFMMSAVVWSGRYIKTVDNRITYVRIWEGPNSLDLYYVITAAIVCVIAFGIMGGVVAVTGSTG